MSVPRRMARRLLDAVDERRRLGDRTSPATKIGLRSLYLDYRRLAEERSWLPSSWDTGFRIFSQFDEDGIALFLLALAGDGPRTLVDLGSGDGVNASNSANLILNFGFHGLLVEADPELAARARAFFARHPDSKARPPVTVASFLTRENVNEIVETAGFNGEIDLLSIDVDGNDYWIWRALDRIKPRLVITETHPEYGLDDYVMPYEPGFVWSDAPPELRHGASTPAMVRLAQQLGYRLVAANLYGFNLFFARKDIAPQLPEITIEELRRRTTTGFPVDPS
jgi:hypothetical protein